ncbi:DNA-binding domain-containing protein, AraC-type [Polaromonas sp. CF318]|uniref:AraC family transcriptional regulator n=1 Tax=Polaromonas sp. CF318 TaxID=1144318 RepID=UPI0002714C2F|nr:AraC family transcriptional regulator [Polaromonas sp. CF318]EJL87106.1 DNA-binding domain-containing protein, AraC-type [Polaromonas sp. CF318]
MTTVGINAPTGYWSTGPGIPHVLLGESGFNHANESRLEARSLADRSVGGKGSAMTAASETVEKHTVSVHFVQAAVRHLTGPARERALAAAGITPQVLEAQNARVPANAYSALWLAVARELDDEFFGLDKRPMKVGSFALLCQAVLSCADLDRAVKRMLRGFSLFLGDVKGELRLEEDKAVLRLTNEIQDPEDRRFADETMLIFIHGLMCWLAGRRVPLGQVTFAHPRPYYAQEYRLMYCDDIVFGAAQTTMQFEGRALSVPVVQNAATLQQFLRTAPQSVFLKYRNEDSWTAQVRRRLRGVVGDPGDWPGFEQLAMIFGTTPTTLRRRLEAEGTSFQAIKDHLRNDMAIDLLCHTTLSVDEIGARLGFQEASAFHRAFKRWNGIQPGEYRRRQLGVS